MDSLKYCLISITALILIMIIKEYENRFAILLRIAVAVGLGSVCASMFSLLYEYIKNNAGWFSVTEESAEIFSLMIKVSGISFIGCITSSLCRDSGENGLASSAESICKLEIILLCIPIIDFITEKIQHVI